jgi:LmbE family N-acetylglucosaminyl deacetylase
MKLTPTSPEHPPVDILAFGAHPDDIEFGCGAVIVKETLAGRSAHLVVCSRGESGSHGTPEQRTSESETAAALLGASLEFLTLDGDAHLEIRTAHALAIAAIIRRQRPRILLSPTPYPNQHPDHARLAQMIRDAARLARYGGIEELRSLTPHIIDSLFFYPLSPDSENASAPSILVDVSAPQVIAAWTAAMQAHASQLSTRKYVELQLARTRLHGLHAGVGHAMLLYPNDLLLFDSLTAIPRGARHF